jgi:phosphoenolpyruvate carboxylase
MDVRHETVPLRADIRLLGGVLGEVIREQDGQALFDRIEAIRQASVSYHREPSQDRSESLQALLSALDLDQTVRFAHSFASFSQLTNIAEDQARRRLLRHPDADARPDTVTAAMEALQAEGVGRDEVLALVQQMYIAPVLTAHPTEIRRKSIIDRVGAISALLDAIDGRHSPVEREQLQAELHRQVVILWKTRLLRPVRLVVNDEIDTVVGHIEHTFLRELPKLYAEWERALVDPALPSFFRAGSWVGGDRDGNPNVGADSLRAAFGRQAKAAIAFYLEEIHALGAELSFCDALAKESAALEALAERSRDPSPHRKDEPYRRALSGVYARLASTYAALTGETPARSAA